MAFPYRYEAFCTHCRCTYGIWTVRVIVSARGNEFNNAWTDHVS